MVDKCLALKNAIYWDAAVGDKVHIEKAQLSVAQFPFSNRQVFVRFAGGPNLDFSIYDMDRFVAAYLELRGIRPPQQLCDSDPPHPCDFWISTRRNAKR